MRRWSSKYNWVHRVGECDKFVFENVLRHKEEILDQGMARLLGMMDKALDELEAILDIENTIHVDDGTVMVINQKLKAIDTVLNRIGLVGQKQSLEVDKPITINQYVQNIYKKMRDKEKCEVVNN